MLIRSLLLLVPAIALSGGCASSPKKSALDTEAAPARSATVAQACGQTDDNADFRGLKSGSLVRLAAHVEDDVPPNWSPDMDFYLGKVTKVDRPIGVDEQGCPGVYVEADAHVFFWRVRDLEVLDGMAAATRCGQSEWGADFLGLEPGMRVEIQQGTDWYGDRNWVDEMDAYVGQSAKMLDYSGVDEAGCPGVSLDIDEGAFFWRVRDLSPAAPPVPAAPAAPVAP